MDEGKSSVATNKIFQQLLCIGCFVAVAMVTISCQMPEASRSSRPDQSHPVPTPPAMPPAPTIRSAPTAPIPSPPRQTNAVVRPTLPTTRAPIVASQNVLGVQVALARRGFSSGSIDGVAGDKTRNALKAFQRQQQLSSSGDIDDNTLALLLRDAPLLTRYEVTDADLGRLLPVGATWWSKSQQPRLDYETIEELVAEKHRCSPTLLTRLNPGVDWRALRPGTGVTAPHIPPVVAGRKSAFARIYLADRALQAFDEKTNLLAHFPCSIAQSVAQRPVGELHVAVLIPDPNYTFDPALFRESAEARQRRSKLIIPPGPNNPVGKVWIGLDRSGYGIHGTPRPEQVGRAESHGCFRLTNWDAEYFLELAWIGMPVYVVEHGQ